MSTPERSQSQPRTLPTPVVLALASVMLSVGVAGFGTGRIDGCGAKDPSLPVVRLHLTTPQGAAETYLDAWRKRRFDLAADVSVEEAHGTASQRARTEALLEDDAVLKLWRQLADKRLDLDVRETEYPSDDRVILHGLATGEFMKRPYLREVTFETVQRREQWLVARMQLGSILEGPDTEHLQGLE